MQKSLITCALMLSFNALGQGHATDCSQLEQWHPDSIYTSGTSVQNNNIIYQANWWNIGNDPASHSGPWQEWTKTGSCTGGSDNQAPNVNFTSPLNNTQFTENTIIVLSAKASDSDGTVESVEFLLGERSLGTITTPPYSLDWKAVTGSHTITARVTDNQGVSTLDHVSISVVSATNNQPPVVNLASPTVNSQIKAGDTVMIAANASDPDGAVTQVDFYLDDQLLGSDTNAPFELDWKAETGPRKFMAKAVDNENASTISETISVTVTGQIPGGACASVPSYQSGHAYQAGDIVQNLNNKYRCNIAGWCSSNSAWAYEPGKGQHWAEAWSDLGICAIVPEVNITTPSENSLILTGSNITIEATATDGDGSIAQVEFFAGNTSIGADKAAPYSANWVATGVGDISLKAVATDNEGNNAESSILVSLSDQALVTSLTSPVSGTTVNLGKAITLSATASSLNSSIQKVDFLVNGSVAGSDDTAPYSIMWTAGSAGSYTVTALATDTKGNTALSSAASVKVIDSNVTKKHKLIGYWHNFVNGAGCPMRLRDISPAWDVIDIAFAENDRNSDGTVHFNLYSGDIYSSCPALDPAQFKQDMRELQAQGKVIVLSLGGAEGTITLNTDSDEAKFVNSLTNIIKEWGFDGLDVDLESGSNLLHGTQIQARLPRALRKIETNIGGDMYLTMAPEHPYVQGGMIAYSGIWGAYIPLIDELRDTLDLLHVQLYNNGGLANPYMPGAAPEGSVDMMVASARMLIEGFELANGTMFQPLRDDQVAIGLPSGPSSANSGQAPTQNIVGALDCMTLGTSCGSVVPTKLYPNFGGVMTWSINWDQHDGYNFSGPIGDKLKAMNSK